jgi:hypothetical protein
MQGEIPESLWVSGGRKGLRPLFQKVGFFFLASNSKMQSMIELRIRHTLVSDSRNSSSFIAHLFDTPATITSDIIQAISAHVFVISGNFETESLAVEFEDIVNALLANSHHFSPA